MKNLIEKSTEQIKDRIEFWFFKYYNKTKTDFNGNEIFTLFELLNVELQVELKPRLNLEGNESPVLVLKISESEFVINTTKKFIRINSDSTDIIDYTEFECHNGYKRISIINTPTGKVANVKTEGLISDFGLRKRNGKIIYWKIPSGKPGFAFWNVTKKCELIGRKFKITE
jgi:hypothetical protein